ncbi:Fe(2+) transporter permease subunit FeoB [Methylocystis hirsuta]|uniref:Ferrous iron transport protein B n=2 Tax=Methylocystis hirsuta TaxID=369798 RepID=A0A3M9XJN4_9HYPH|nr:Fe(2+) transporter permease subunit FeoB [Methylocystis hirsuta]
MPSTVKVSTMTTKLGDLKVGERGRVIGFERGDIGHRQKLLSMGLTPGGEFAVMRVAPLGEPVEVRVRDTSLSLRRDEVSDLLIERIGAQATVMQGKALTIAIIGNPNCGKSTLFNGLTGTRQRVGNWPGVTVEKKVGLFQFENQSFQIVDLPGIYSLDAYDEESAIDERIARDYILSGEADLIVNIADASNLERNLYLTTQLLEMRVPLVVVLNIMEEDAGSRSSQFDATAIERGLGCPVVALVATRQRDVEGLKDDLQLLARMRPRPRFGIDYPPQIENAVSELANLIDDTSGAGRFDNRWLAIRLLEGDAFATEHVVPAAREARARLAGRIAQDAGDEADVVIANSRYRFVHALTEEAAPKRAAVGRSISARIDSLVLNRLLGIPIFLGVMYCLFWFTIQFARAFKPFFNLVSDTLFVEGSRHLLAALHAPAWLIAVLADGLGNGLLQVVNFIPIIGFLYLFVSVIEESGYMARANFVMDRLMQALGLPGNAFVPMVVGFGCNVPAIMATRTLERPRDRIVAVLMSPFMSCGGRLAVYMVFAAAFFPENGQLVIFGVYLLGVVFAMVTALVMKNSLLPQERSLYALELPSYHWPKPRNVLIGAWIRVKMFVMRVDKFIIPMVFVLKVLSAWGTDGSFNQQPIDQSVLAAGGRTITPVLAPMGVGQDQWPATVALLTGVLHKVVIVSTLESIYLEAKNTPPVAQQEFDLLGRLERAVLTIPQNLKALIGLGAGPMRAAHRPLVDFDRTVTEPARVPGADSALAPALASRFDGTVGALAYLILALCYPCIATTAATTRETNQRWTGFMVFWTISLGYGMAVLFYQIGTFISHPASSAAWIVGVVTYFALLGAVALAFSPFGADAYPKRLHQVATEGQPLIGRPEQLVGSRKGVTLAISAALLTIAFAAILVAYAPKLLSRGETEKASLEKQPPAPTEQAPPMQSPAPIAPKDTGSPIERQTETAPREAEATTTTARTHGESSGENPLQGVESPPAAQAPKVVGKESAKPSAETSPSAPADTYTIVAGDSLRSLAVRLYGDERQWRSIVTANPGLDPRRLHVGQVIKLPRPAPQRDR